MISNLDKYKKDLDQLIEEGDNLLNDMNRGGSSFKDNYQSWYSESLAIIKFCLL